MTAHKTNGAPPYTPDPDEMAYRCRQVQRRWTKAEELARRAGTNKQTPYAPASIAESVFGVHVTDVRSI